MRAAAGRIVSELTFTRRGDGATREVTVRHTDPATDGALLGSLYSACEPSAIRLRFLHPITEHLETSPHVRRRLVVDGDRGDISLIASSGEEGAVAEAELRPVNSPGVATLGLLVSPALHGFGLAKHLLATLIGMAQERGLTLLVAEVLPENDAVRTLLERPEFGFVPMETDDGYLEYRLRL